MAQHTLVYPTQPYPAPARPVAFQRSCSLFVGLFLGLLITLFGAGVGGFFYFQDSQRILPGVHVYGTPLGLMTEAEAAEALTTAWSTNPPTLLLSDGKNVWQAPAPQLGLQLDAAATARRAAGLGRDGALDLFGLAETGLAVEPVIVFDAGAARQALTILAQNTDSAPQNAGFRIENGQVVSTPPQNGQRLDVEGALALLSASPAGVLRNGYLPLLRKPVAPAVTDVSAVLAQVSGWLARPLPINIYDAITDERQTWSVPPERVAEWIEVGDGGQTAALSEDKVKNFVTAQSLLLGGERYLDSATAPALILQGLQSGQAPTLIVRHSPTAYIVQAGDNLTRIGWKTGVPYWRIVQANPGLQTSGLSVGQSLTIPSLDDLLPLPVVPNKRVVVSISRQTMQVYENQTLINEYVISTGIDRSPTQPGVFQIQTHEVNAYASLWDLWMPHFMGIYEAGPDFMNGIHGLPMLSSGRRLWADVLGRPASYGCIILNLADAEALYNWAENGVVVVVQE